MEQVSVIIPTYNRAQFLQKAIHSVLVQQDFSGEVIVVDDGSTDDSIEIVNQIRTKHLVRYVHIENSGPSAARNHGVQMAQFDLIAFLDSDDTWRKDKLRKQISFLNKNPDYSICHTDEKWYRRGIHLNKKDFHQPRHGDIFSHCLKLCAVGMSTVLMRRDLFNEFDGFDTQMACCEDYDFWLRISSKYHFLLLPDPLTIKDGGRLDQLSYKYRVGIDKFRIYAIKKLLDTFELQEWQYELAARELAKKCRIYGLGCLKHGKTEEGNHYLSLQKNYITP